MPFLFQEKINHVQNQPTKIGLGGGEAKLLGKKGVEQAVKSWAQLPMIFRLMY